MVGSAIDIARVRELVRELHSFAGIIEKIYQQGGVGDDETGQLAELALALSHGLDAATALTKALNRTALSVHLELLSRKS